MNKESTAMFPTRSKTKIAKTLAYPVKAKFISQALADVPQAEELSLDFTYWRSTAASHKQSLPYVILSVEYRYNKASQFTPHYFEEDGLNEPSWRIIIQPVPSELKYHVAQLLESQALPPMRDWLFAKSDVTGREDYQSFNVFYDEANDRLQFGQS